jgi:putative oligomerization/nucleic acid binding protein
MPRGFGGGFGRGGFRMRRSGRPIIVNSGMGGMGGIGSPLMTGLMTGGIGYLLGKSTNQQGNLQAQQMMPPPYYQQSQAPQQPSPAYPSSTDNERLAQLKLLGELHDSGVLTDEEFASEKRRLLGS